jgi:predicted small secreted protein
MKRVLVLLLAVAALVAGCGSSSGSGSGGSSGGSSSVSATTAAGVLNAASAATKDATSAAFDAKLGIKLGGQLAGAGAGAALLQGPLSLELKGHAGKATGGKGKFDVDFALNYTGGSFSGEALSPDGKTLYVKMPLLMGPGWHSLPLSGLNSSSAGSSSSSSSAGSGLDALKAEGADPSKWLKNLSLSTSGGEDTISADVDFAKLFADISKVSQSGITAKDRLQMAQVQRAIKTAHGSLSFDSSTHLPTEENIKFSMDLPPSLQTQANGLKSVDLNLDIKFSEWNQDFTVKAPAGATPFNSAGLVGGLGA